jgi:hypothetical protein
LALKILTRIQPHPKRLPHKEGQEGKLIQHGNIVHRLWKEEERRSNVCTVTRLFLGGGIHRFKEHLAKYRGNVVACKKVDPEVAKYPIPRVACKKEHLAKYR